MDEKVKKIEKKPLYIILAILAVMVVSIVAAVIVKMNKPEPVMAETGVELYWNIDRDEFVGDSSAGVSSRERAEDGFYKVRFAVGGEQVEYNVEKARLMHEIDKMDIMGLAIDEEGTITDVFDPEEITGGEVASMYYVVIGNENNITLCPEETLEEDYINLPITEDTGIYNVTGMDPVGFKDTPITSDCIRAFKNEEGETTHIFIVSRHGYWPGEVQQGHCEHCDQVVDWYVWEEKYALPTESGHWLLSNDVKASAQYKILDNQKVIVDLNGKTVTGATDKRVYAMTGKDAFLAILDSSAEGTGTVIGRGAPDNGGIVLVRYGTLELYSGTLDASNIATPQYASAVRVNTDAVFNMYNGTVIGGTAVGTMDEAEKSTKGGYGGTIQVGGTFNLYDGVIRDGKALRYEKKNGDFTCGNGGNIHIGTDGVFNMYGGSILNGTADRAGGNIYMSKNAVVNMSGGVISGGAVADDDRYGGNIYVHENSQALNLTGGTIEKGKALGAGGNIALYGTLNMSGGTVKDGSCMTGKTLAEGVHNEEYPHHNIYCAGGTLNMSGGLVEGYLRIRDTSKKECTVNISGTAQIKGGSINLSLDPGDEVNISDLSKGADIRVNGGGFVSTVTAKANAAYVHSSYAGVETQYIDNKIFIGKQACICGETEKHIGDCNGTLLDWIPWGTPTTMPNVAANWYLVCDVTMDDQVKIEEKANFNLDLNGHKVTGAENTRVYALRNGEINLAITDHSADNRGIIVAKGKDMGRGAVIWVSDNGNMKMYGGTLDGSAATGIYSGTTVTVDKDCSFTLYDGTVKGGTSAYNVTEKDGKVKKENGYGGAIYVSGTFDMYDGAVTGGVAANSGGNLFVGKTGTFNLYGGEVLGGNADIKGGNIAGTGKVNIYDGIVSDGKAGTYGGNIFSGNGGNVTLHKETAKVTGGSAKQGGNIYIEPEAVVTMNAGTFGAGESSAHGGSVAVYGKFYMNGGQIANSEAKEQGGNIFVGKAGTLNFNGGKVVDGVAGTKGGNIAGTGTINIAKGAVVENGTAGSESGQGGNLFVSGIVTTAGEFVGGTAKNGGNVYVNGATFKMTDGSITGGTAGENGGAVNIARNVVKNDKGDITEETIATFEMTGGTISGGISEKQGGNVFVGKKCTFDLNGGNVLAGTAGEKGGNFAGTGIVNIKLGLVSKGTAGIYGGNIFTSTEITMDGGVISDGTVKDDSTTKGKGGNVYLEAGQFTMNNGEITGGKAYQGGSVFIDISAAVTVNNGQITGGVSKNTGGNVYVAADTTDGKNAGVLTLVNGTISNGDATQGGNVYLQADSKFNKAAAELQMTGGTISGGTVDSAGGNVAALGVFNMSGGTITGGKTDATSDHKYGANIYTVPEKQGCSFTMTGGTIEGLVRANNEGQLIIGGIARITNESGNMNLTLHNNATISIGDLREGALIGINADSSKYFATGAVAEDVNCFTVDDGISIVELTEGDKLIIAEPWIEWTTDNALPTSGKYRLKTNVDLSGALKVEGNKTLTLDLNGFDVKATTSRVFQLTNEGSTLNIMDMSADADGAISVARTSDTTGAVLLLRNSTVNFYSGIIDASGMILQDKDGKYVEGKNGAAVSIEQSSVFNMYGGTIKGGKAYNGGSINVANTGTLNMEGGTITGGYASSTGGNVYVEAGTTPGTFNMIGGTVTLGTAVQGGNIYASAGSTTKEAAIFTISGGAITKGKATTTAGNIASLGAFTMTGGEIKGGICTNTSDHKYAANVYTLPGKNKCTFTMTGGIISGWIRVNNAGSLVLGGVAKITNGSDNVIVDAATNTFYGNSGTCGLHISKQEAEIVMDSENALAEGAEIYLSANTMTSGTSLITGTIAETYQKYFKLCGSGELSFADGEITVK
ncbi:MAG: hypothetical protein IJZ53_04155 [Tyzzerella sp.]|nr:hypothetical protein [Tyzzerella sp.]